MTISVARFLTVLERPEQFENASKKDWEQLIRICRNNDMLGTLGCRPAAIQVIPEAFKWHLLSAAKYSKKQACQIEIQVKTLMDICSHLNIKVFALKGLAYQLAKDECAVGRIMSDIDMLVEKTNLSRLEHHLLENGWSKKLLDDYDEMYYREWAHEIPPLVNRQSGATLDLHHNIIPPVTGIRVDLRSVMMSATSDSETGIFIFSTRHRLLHCIIHFYFNEDYSKAVRDIWDIHLLFQKLIDEEGRVDGLLDESISKCFNQEIANALYLESSIFGSAYSEAVKDFIQLNASKMVQFLLVKVLKSNMNISKSFTGAFYLSLMAMRGHFVKMPLRILFPHIFIKLWRGAVKSIFGAYHYEKK